MARERTRGRGAELQSLPVGDGADNATEAALLGDELVPLEERGRVLAVGVPRGPAGRQLVPPGGALPMTGPMTGPTTGRIAVTAGGHK